MTIQEKAIEQLERISEHLSAIGEKEDYTDIAIKALEQYCEDAGEISDGYHTFNQLYHQRAILFATIVNQNKDKAWKSFKHSDGKYCFDSDGKWFIVGVDTPQGSYTYHYSKEYWDMFDCQELECGKEWDGHTEEDVTRLLSLEQQPSEDTEVIKIGKGAVKARQGRFVIYDVDWLKENFYTTEEKIYGQPKQTCIEDYPTCTECEHYDRDKHYCPRFCQVIKDTLAEAQPTDAKETIIKSALKYLVKMQIEEGSVGFAVDNDHDHDCCWDDVLAWLKAQPCEDCISREAVRKVLSNEVFELMKLHSVNPKDNPKADAMAHGVNWSLNTLMELPSVTPQTPKGKWIEYKVDIAPQGI